MKYLLLVVIFVGCSPNNKKIKNNKEKGNAYYEIMCKHPTNRVTEHYVSQKNYPSLFDLYGSRSGIFNFVDSSGIRIVTNFCFITNKKHYLKGH